MLFTIKNRAIWLQALFFIVLLLLGKINALEIVIIYALETIIIGLFHIIKLVTIGVKSKKKKLLKATLLTIFFALHYGFFVFIQTTFFFVFLSFEDSRITSSLSLENLKTVLTFPGIQLAIIIFTILGFAKYYINFYKEKTYNNISIELYTFQPYLRVFIQQFTIIIPGVFIIYGNAGIIVAVFLIIIRLIIDLFIFNIKTDNTWLQKGVNLIFKKDGNASKKEIENFLFMSTNE